jgi:acetylornithine deacetylase
VLTVSIIQGGHSEHVVPETCSIAIDRRTVPGEKTPEVVEEIRRWIREDLGAEAAGRVEIHHPHHDAPPMETPEGHPLVQALRSAVEAVRGEATVSGVPYNTDGGVLSQSGVPVVVFGSGDIAQAHTPTEFVEVEQVAAEVEILKRLLRGGLWL